MRLLEQLLGVAWIAALMVGVCLLLGAGAWPLWLKATAAAAIGLTSVRLEKRLPSTDRTWGA